MILVHSSQMLLKTPPAPDLLSGSILRVDNEIKRILERTDTADNGKVLAYLHALQQYTSKIKHINTRLPITNQLCDPQVRKVETTPTMKSQNRLIKSLPKTL